MSQTAPKTPLGKTDRLVWLLAPHASRQHADRLVTGFGKGNRARFGVLSERFSILSDVGGTPCGAGDDLSRFLFLKFNDVAGIEKMGQFVAPTIKIDMGSSDSDEEPKVTNSVYALCPAWHHGLGAQRIQKILQSQASGYLVPGINLSFLSQQNGFDAFKNQNSIDFLPVVGGYDPDNQLMFFFDEEGRHKMMRLYGISAQTPEAHSEASQRGMQPK